MKKIISSIEKAIENKNPEVALVTALMLPDICGKIEFPRIKNSKPRYRAWYNKYLLKKFVRDNSTFEKMARRSLEMWELMLEQGFKHPSHCIQIETLIAKEKQDLSYYKNNRHFVFMSSLDCYLLRCSISHEGSDEISSEIMDTVKKFHFHTKEGGLVHNNKKSEGIQFDVYQFCKDILDAVNEWLKDIKNDEIKQTKINELIKIVPITKSKFKL